MPKGGSRAGSGRKPKPTSEVRITRTFRLLPDADEAIARLAAAAGITPAAWIERQAMAAVSTLPVLAADVHATRDPYQGTGGVRRWDCTACNGVGEARETG